MAYRSLTRLALLGAAGLMASIGGSASAAYLFWMPPSFAGEAVHGDEPGLGQTLPDATKKEQRAALIWNMRAALNVAALQCQFSPALMAVRNYNDLLRQHGGELTDSYTAISGYFKRTGGKNWQTLLDQFTTRTYNGFSTMHAQIGFCETTASVSREAIGRRKGELYLTAEARSREIRNSLIPASDGLFYYRPVVTVGRTLPLSPDCWDKKNRLREKCDTSA